MSELKIAIGYNLAFYRKLKRLTQTEVAEKIDIDASTLSKYESGTREPTFQTLEKLAELYGCRVADFLGHHSSTNDQEAERYFQAILNLPLKKKKMVYKMLDAILEEENNGS